ncbi:MAG: phosphohistidine phosphatase [Gammaproteobacteria bacterium HGW-Gammaproteobacteria-10]|nr:MAG: phosphohistidine phosphatase [Gammaproteobacteria bacterium HGW-Gammaproteobacteria-3]PKM35455.1 MAG: phosphohistidine phosphatase [Gammaproteobacteria bacterium HGW-Gammaproteobacteria-10]
MNRELLLLRHGKSDWTNDCCDFDRPLKKRGQKASFRIGEWLLEQNLVPDWVVSSPAARAALTTENVCRAIKLPNKLINFDERIYQADVDSLKNVLADCPSDKQRVLLVGHNPELERLLNYLVGAVNVPEDGKLLPTATLARLRMPEDWRKLDLHGAKLLSVTRAKSLS